MSTALAFLTLIPGVTNRAKYASNILQQGDNLAVYTGIWFNRSLGGAYGATLTLDRKKGGFLISFLALYVGASGGSFWKLTRFFLHRLFSSKNRLDGVYHQRQAVLRNSHLPEDAAVSLLQASLAWRKRAYKVHWRLLPSAIIAIVIATAFALAGVFSSKVTTNSLNEILLSGRNCGIIEDTNQEGISLNDFQVYRSQKLTGFLDYASQCYQHNQSDQPDRCQILAQPRLPYTADRNATCPFSRNMCVLKDNNLVMDTGYLDSNDYLGLNAGPRFLFRQSRSCSPIVTEGYKRLDTDKDDPSIQYLRYYYGASSKDFLYSWRVNASRPPIDMSLFRSPESDYKASAFWGRHWLTKLMNFELMPQLNRTDSEVTLIFLDASSIITGQLVEDPWFSSNIPFDISISGSLSNQARLPADTQWYGANEPTVLGCITSQFVCNPRLPADRQCINLQQQYNEENKHVDLATLWPKNADHAAVRAAVLPISGELAFPDPYFSTPGLGSVLLSRSSLLGPIQTGVIPEDRWKTEMEYIFQANLASIQWQMVNAAGGSLFWNYGYDGCTAEEPCEKHCKIQKVKSSEYYSFSILGISIILALGGAIMLAAFFIEEITDGLAKLLPEEDPESAISRLEWKANSTLQLQRQVHEALGAGTWSSIADITPVTEKGELLATLDTADPKHPRLIRTTSSSGSMSPDVESGKVDISPSSSQSDLSYSRDSPFDEDGGLLLYRR